MASKSNNKFNFDSKKVENQIKEAAQHGLDEFTRDIFDLSQFDVPVDTGDLKNSGQIDYGEFKNQITYTADHAAVQHERDFNHPMGGTKKYLEKNLYSEANKLDDEIANAISAEMTKK